MIIYLTYNEQPSGIYSSQVIDVVRFINVDLKVDIKLVSFISIRGFFRNKDLIKSQWPKAIIIPMIPGIKRWKWNRTSLKILLKVSSPSCIIARSVLATNLALDAKAKKVIYDGRGAIAAEWIEYNVVNNERLVQEIEALEQKSVRDSDFRIAVSEKLVEYWRKSYKYDKMDHVVIPCTLNAQYLNLDFDEKQIKSKRVELGFSDADNVFVYSGSLAGWQSFELIHKFALTVLGNSKSNKLLFLSDEDPEIECLRREFPDQVRRMRLGQKQVPDYLIACDYGLLIRERSVTNEVASPVKFAEYLACGLKVIISEHIGDYSELIVKKELGCLYTSSFSFSDLNKVKFNKNKNREVALKYFTKESHIESYKKLIEFV